MLTPVDLLEKLDNSDVTLFCGAGISLAEGGWPGSRQLAQELARKGDLGEVNGVPFAQVAQNYELLRKRKSLVSLLASYTEDRFYPPLRTHRLIAELPFKRIITTNWDTFLEEALRQARKPYRRVVRNEEVSFTEENKVALIKFHGSIDQKDSLVITTDDHMDILEKRRAVVTQIRSYLTSTLLFLGFRLTDDDFTRLYHDLIRDGASPQSQGYAVQRNPHPLTIDYWSHKGIQIINTDVTMFLEELDQWWRAKHADNATSELAHLNPISNTLLPDLSDSSAARIDIDLASIEGALATPYLLLARSARSTIWRRKRRAFFLPSSNARRHVPCCSPPSWTSYETVAAQSL